MATGASILDSKITRSPGAIGMVVFGAAMVVGFIYVAVRTRGFRQKPALIDFRES